MQHFPPEKVTDVNAQLIPLLVVNHIAFIHQSNTLVVMFFIGTIIVAYDVESAEE